MKFVVLVLILFSFIGCVTQEQCKNIAIKEADSWKEIGHNQGWNEGYDVCNEDRNCPWDKWEERDRYCLEIFNGENEYKSAWRICKDNSDDKYEQIKVILEEK